MKLKIILRTLISLLIICNVALIFHFSSEKASVSSKTSKKVTEQILEIFIEDFSSMPEKEQKALIKKTDSTIRSLAHFTEYTALGFLTFAFFSLSNSDKIKKALLSFTGCALFSLADEVHQIFVPGRSFQFKDISIDFAGVILGILIFLFIKHIIKKLTKKSAVS